MLRVHSHTRGAWSCWARRAWGRARTPSFLLKVPVPAHLSTGDVFRAAKNQVGAIFPPPCQPPFTLCGKAPSRRTRPCGKWFANAAIAFVAAEAWCSTAFPVPFLRLRGLMENLWPHRISTQNPHRRKSGRDKEGLFRFSPIERLFPGKIPARSFLSSQPAILRGERRSRTQSKDPTVGGK